MAVSTRQALLQALSAAGGSYVSGQQLAETLGVSRAAVHKAAAALTAQGYALEAAPRRGYRLAGGDPFCTEAIGDYPAPIYLYDTLESSNRTAKLLALDGAPHGTLVLTAHQSAGRGRLGRSSSFRRGSGLGRHVFDGQGFDLEHGGFIAGTRAGHIGVAQRGHHEDHGHEGGHLGQHAAGTAAAEHRGIAATENDAHTFLAGLQENENDEHHTNNDMKRQNKGLHKSLPGARRK